MKNIIKCKKFKGEIEIYLKNQQKNFESKIDCVFKTLRFKTWLCRTNISKADGYHSAHLLFVLILLPLLKLKTVHNFCEKHWINWSNCKKDAFYRFKKNSRYRWRSFMRKINMEIFNSTGMENTPREELHFVIDDTNLPKTGRKIENVSFVHDHNANRNILGFCVVMLGLFTPKGFYPLDFAYRFGKNRHAKSPEKIGDLRSAAGKRSYEAKHYTKLELALMMIKNTVKSGILPGYVMFDSWYSWPWLINAIRKIDDRIHVICRLKNSNVQYEYEGKRYKLSELYQKVKSRLKKNKKTELLLYRVNVKIPESDETSVIVFSKGYNEPELDNAEGKRKQKKEKWAAFLSTNKSLHASSIIKKYVKRWPIEVCFKECKQMLVLGKEHSNSFNAQVFSTTISFLTYNILNFLNEKENYSTLGELFESIVDESAVTTYAHRLWDFFYGLFDVSISKIFEIFEINVEFQSYIDSIDESLRDFKPFQGCET